MIQQGITTRVGPICRTVEDVARVLDVYAGFDPKDELTAFSIDRVPAAPYQNFAKKRRLDGVRIGVIREYMDKDLFSVADHETIDIVDKAVADLRNLGAQIVDPGNGGALFKDCVDKYSPVWRNRLFIGQFPTYFPPATDHIPLLVNMFFNLSLVPHDPANGQPNIRNLGPAAGDTGDAKYNFNVYLKERGDPAIQSVTDLINKANFWTDPVIANRKANLQTTDAALTLASQSTLQNRFALQTVIFQCFAEMALDAVTYPTGNVPPTIITNPEEPNVNDRSGGGLWTFINSRGFPAITVPAGFTTVVYDRDANLTLVGPTPAKLPVGIDFLCLPFGEPTCLSIASAYEAATQHRAPPPDFGPLDDNGNPINPSISGKPRKMPKPLKRSETAQN